MNALGRLWRWFTLADAPVAKIPEPVWECLECGQPALFRQTLQVNGKKTADRFSCREHVEIVFSHRFEVTL